MEPNVLEPASAFVSPQPQPALGGALGLTSKQIAASLGMKVSHVNDRLKRRGYADDLRAEGFVLAATAAASKSKGNFDKRGDADDAWVLDVEAAKVFVAQTRTRIGIAYVKYLLSCERIAERAIPQLLTRIAELEQRIERLVAPKTRRIPGRGLVTVITKTLKVVDLFGAVHEEIVRERKLYDELSPAEQRAYKIQHRSAVMRAIAALQDEDINPKDDEADRDDYH